MRYLAGILVLLCLPAVGAAWDYACGDENGLRTYLTNTDPSEVLTQPDCNQIPEEATEAQRTSLKTDPTIQTAGRPDIRKVRVVDGLAVAKAQADRDAIDAADALAAAEQQAIQDELTNNPACAALNAQDAEGKVEAQRLLIEAQIDGMTAQLASIQATMKFMNNHMATMFKHSARCIFAIKNSG